EAAEIMGITAPRLKALGLIDQIIEEPVGGAHRDLVSMVSRMHPAITEALRQFSSMRPAELVRQRQKRIADYGKFREVTA
ncbi:MAG: acetyl-CoA carboxylase carboxyl transferase subunit alpha, partial [Lautropia sp.]